MGATAEDRAAILERTKAQWRADPCWDLEDAGSTEAERADLRAYQAAVQAAWAAEADRALAEDAVRWGCDPATARVLRQQADALAALEQRLAALTDRVALLEAEGGADHLRLWRVERHIERGERGN